MGEGCFDENSFLLKGKKGSATQPSRLKILVVFYKEKHKRLEKFYAKRLTDKLTDVNSSSIIINIKSNVRVMRDKV